MPILSTPLSRRGLRGAGVLFSGAVALLLAAHPWAAAPAELGSAAAAAPSLALLSHSVALRLAPPTGLPTAAPVPADTSATGLAAVLADMRRRLLAIEPASDTHQPQSSNAGQQLSARYAAGAYQVAARPDSLGRSAWQVRWTLAGIGRVGQPGLPATACPDTLWAGQRLTYRQPAYDVVYDNTEAGVRQTFVLHQRPAGPTALPVRVRLAVAAPGLHWQADATGAVTFRQGAQPVLRYADLRAWDAAGQPLTARLHATPDGTLALEVADAGAQYPLTIDPLASTTAATQLDGAATNDLFGQSVASAGDVDGDGYADVLVGAFTASPGGRTSAGSVYLYRGSATGLSTTTATRLDGALSGDQFGQSVASAGDVDGDGYADVLVGAYAADPGGRSNAGSVYLYRGSAAGLSTPTRLDGAAADDYFGTSVAGAGDVDGDGYADVLVGAYLADPGGRARAGSAYLYRGSATGLSTTAATQLDGALPDDQFGRSVASAGDVDGDGYADVLVGTYAADPGGRTSAGSAYLYRGSAAGLSTTAATQLDGALPDDQFGQSIASAGDVDGDGYADVLVGAPFTDPGGRTNAGSVYLYRGSATGLSTTVATRLDGALANDQFGISVAGAGDVDGDGYADVLVGAYVADPGGRTNAGSVYLYRGSVTGLSTTAATRLDGALANDQFGISVAGAGDVDGDGYADVLVGAYTADPGGRISAGSAYLYRGSAAGLSTTAATQLDGALPDDQFGQSIASAGDVDGDGYADVLVGAYRSDPGGRSNAGSVYLYRGSATGLSTATPTRLDGAAADDYFGTSVAGAGDVDGDGYADVLVGAYLADPGGRARAGSVYLYRGSATGLSTTAATQLDGALAIDRFGRSVAGAGDIDSDGYDDVLVGAYGASPGGRNEAGSAFLYRGSAAGLSTTAAIRLDGAVAGDYFGTSVAGAGDVDGDGYADVLVGANEADPGGRTSAGSAYLYRGSATGLNSTNIIRLDGTVAGDYFGISVAGAGDVDGDSYADVLVGAYFASPGGRTNAGSAFLYRGSAAGLSPTATRLDGAQTADQFGYSVASAGDVDGDGYADVLVGVYGADPGGRSNAGSAYLYRGSATGLGLGTPTRLDGAAANDYFGTSVAGAGDVNGDGYADVLVGANMADPGGRISAGAAYLYRGNAGTARRGALRLYNTDLTTPLSAANRSLGQFGLGLVARSPYGRSKARLVWETRANGQAFSSSSPITNSTQFTARGPWTDLPVGTVTELKSLVSKTGLATKVRARLEYASAALAAGSSAAGTGGVGGQARYGPWVYVSAQQLGQSSSQATPLPVELTAFTATLEGKAAVRLAWVTASEKNSASFEVQRSLDGKTFAAIGPVAAAGSSPVRRSYTFLDAQLPVSAATLYYRLRQVDTDGSFSYSPVRVVARAAALSVYPNPAAGPATLTGAVPGASVQVFTALGRLVLSTTADATGTARLGLPAGLPAGVYVVRAGGQAVRLVRQ